MCSCSEEGMLQFQPITLSRNATKKAGMTRIDCFDVWLAKNIQKIVLASPQDSDLQWASSICSPQNHDLQQGNAYQYG